MSEPTAHGAGPTGGRPAGSDRPNALSPRDAEREPSSCRGPRRRARTVAEGRPRPDAAVLKAVCDAASAGPERAEAEEAPSRHPRIGERPEGTDRESARSRRGRAGAVGAGREVLRRSREGAAAHEERFGHALLACAAGLDAERTPEASTGRLGDDEETRRRIVREEPTEIAHLRPDKLLERS